MAGDAPRGSSVQAVRTVHALRAARVSRAARATRPAVPPVPFRPRHRAVLLAVGGVGALLAVLPTGIPVSAAGSVLAALVALTAGVVTWRHADPGVRPIWPYLAAAVVVSAAGDVLGALAAAGVADTATAGTLLRLGVYPLLVRAVLTLSRRPSARRDVSSLVDSLVVVVAVALVLWALLIEPSISRNSGPASIQLLYSLYPLGDVLLLGLGLRLWFAVGSGATAALRLFGLALLGLFVGDIGFAAGLGGFAAVPPWAGTAGWVSFSLLVAAAASHRSAATPQREPSEYAALTPLRYGVLLAFACLSAPTVMLVRGLEGHGLEAVVLASGSAMLFVLAIYRMNGLVSALEATVRRERTLREGTAALAAVADVDSLRMATLRTLRGLLRPSRADAVAWLFRIDGADVSVLAASGTGDPPGPLGPVADLYTGGPSHLRVQGCGPRIAAVLGVPIGTRLTVVPIGTTEGPRELAVVATAEAPSERAVTTVRTFSAAAALAHDRIALGRSLVERRSLDLLRRMLADSTDVIMLIGPEFQIRHATPAVRRLLGHAPEDLLGRDVLDLIDAPDRLALTGLTQSSTREVPRSSELHFRAADGTQRCVEVVAAPVSGEDDPGWVLTCHDVTDRRELERELAHQAFHDSLTGLANRALFRDRLEQSLTGPDAATFAVLFCDLDDFKTVNDGLGHPAGDELLRVVTARIQESLRPGDTAARLGGDEFAVLLRGPVAVEEACAVAQRILDALARPLVLHGAEITPAASIGIAMSDAGPGAAATLMSNADLALYVAKNAGKRQYAVFEPRMHQRAVDRLTLTGELRRAIDGDELVLQFQPFVRLSDDTVTGFEALVRWRHPDRGLLDPGHFISLAEEAGLIVPLGRWVLQEALRTLATWRDDPGWYGLSMSVNVSGRQMAYPGIVDDVRSALEDSGVPPEMCVLEITESVLLPDDATVQRLQALRELGVSVYIDDFGTGYSSLSYLRQLPVDGLKVAREFVEGLGETDAETGLVRTIRDLGQTLGLPTIIAEGIETDAQRRVLAQLGYEIGQGFGLGMPMAAEHARLLIAPTPVAATPAATPALIMGLLPRHAGVSGKNPMINAE
ncbi:MAG: domain S-box-containing protein/diguanylate cyclase protein [Cryptosporangiaceae bacterium]|jgi:diguanylate cyclase (GGDEF)-like protein/PAS domain S-box-containing protein|nr:domain S-box-containing protein/diguanylate cyclase protein [Cryptosporangiaceae bacterium]